MSENISLKDAERKVFRASFDDGLLDIFLSCFVLMFAIAPYLSVYMGDFWSSLIFLPFWGLLYLLLRWVRKNVVNPRSGVVKYGPMRKRKLFTFNIIFLVLNVLFLILGIVAAMKLTDLGGGFVFSFSAIVLVSFTLAGYFLNLTRLYIYGLMLALAPVIGEWLYQTYGVPHHGFPVVYGFSAGIILLIGLVKFITLVRNNPIPTEEPSF